MDKTPEVYKMPAVVSIEKGASMGFLGIGVILLLSYGASSNRRAIQLRPVMGAAILQLVLAVGLLKTPLGARVFQLVDIVAYSLINASNAGARMLFGESFQEHFFAFSVLSSVVFLSSFTGLLFYAGILQRIIAAMAWIMQKTLRISGSEAMACSANLFVGQIEAALFIKSNLPHMPKSQIFTVMSCGMATIAGSLLVVYVSFGLNAGHILTATLISIPASILISKIVMPDESRNDPEECIETPRQAFGVNMIDAISIGAQQGLKIAFAIAACVLCFVALTAFANEVLSLLPEFRGGPLSLERLLAKALLPVAILIGVPVEEADLVAALIGKMLLFNEFIAYSDLSAIAEQLSPRTMVIATYALCSFANIGSIAIQIGGLSTLAPEKKNAISSMAPRAMLVGLGATLMTACLAGALTGP